MILKSIAGIFLAAIVCWNCLYTVDRAEFAYLTILGSHAGTLDGANDQQAGLHIRWPWPIMEIRRIDRRLQVLELPGIEQLTRDAQKDGIDRTLTIDAYMCWRIADADAVDRLFKAAGGLDEAKSLLAQKLGSELGAACGTLQMDDLVNSKEPARVKLEREKLRTRLLDKLAGPTRDEYGVEIIDVRLRRVSHPAAVRQAIFDRIIAERERKAAEYQSMGEQESAKLRSDTDREVGTSRAKAESDAVRIRGEGEAEADRIRSEAQKSDPDFYSFLRKLEEYQKILGDNRTTLLLSTHRELFDTLFSPPKPAAANPPAAPKPVTAP
jgi:membrane protease subunit HflC